MPLKGRDAEDNDYYILAESDVFLNSNDGGSAQTATATIVKSVDIGRQGDAVATTNTGSFSIIALLKRLLDTTLANVSANLSSLRLTVNNDNRVQTQIMGSVPISVTDNSGSLTVDNAGTFAVQVSTALPSGGNNIGDVDIASLPISYGSGTIDATTLRFTLASGQTIPVSLPSIPAGNNVIGNVNINQGLSFNSGPLDNTTQRVTLATNSSLPPGTNSIGEVTLNSFWGIPAFDRVALTYDNDSNVTTIQYGRGNNVNIATLTLTYSGGNITSIIRTPALGPL
jgi:hypothetical protein